MFADMQWQVLHNEYAKKMFVDELGNFIQSIKLGLQRVQIRGKPGFQLLMIHRQEMVIILPVEWL